MKRPKLESWQTKNAAGGFIQLSYSMIEGAAFRELSARQVLLYLFTVRHRQYTVAILNGAGKGTAATSPAVRWCDAGMPKDCFYLNKALGQASGIYTNEKSGKYDARGFTRDRAALIRLGFIDEVIPGGKAGGGIKAVYRMSERWKTYTKARDRPTIGD